MDELKREIIRILVVDDDNDVRIGTVRLLQKAGYPGELSRQCIGLERLP